MKSYGVNWFLVWVGLSCLFCPIYLWLEDVWFLPWRHGHHLQPPALVQAFGQSLCWTWLYYFIYGKILADPKAIERARQSFQRSELARHRRYRWPLTWTVVFAVVAATSAICRLIFDQPSWLHTVGYSLLVPCGCLGFLWLTEIATKNGQVAQRLKVSEEAP